MATAGNTLEGVRDYRYFPRIVLISIFPKVGKGLPYGTVRSPRRCCRGCVLPRKQGSQLHHGSDGKGIDHLRFPSADLYAKISVDGGAAMD